MKILVGARRSGKTRRMFSWLIADDRRVLLTFSKEEETRLRRQVTEDPLSVLFRDEKAEQIAGRIHYWRDWLESAAHGRRREEAVVGVDNADLVLRQILPWEIGKVSLTDGED